MRAPDAPLGVGRATRAAAIVYLLAVLTTRSGGPPRSRPPADGKGIRRAEADVPRPLTGGPCRRTATADHRRGADPMSTVALVLYAAALVVVFGLRSWVQHRRDGSAGFRGFSGTPADAGWWGGVLFLAAIVLGLAGLLLAVT